MFGEKGLDMLKRLGNMLISGKQGDIAKIITTIVSMIIGKKSIDFGKNKLATTRVHEKARSGLYLDENGPKSTPQRNLNQALPAKKEYDIEYIYTRVHEGLDSRTYWTTDLANYLGVDKIFPKKGVINFPSGRVFVIRKASIDENGFITLFDQNNNKISLGNQPEDYLPHLENHTPEAKIFLKVLKFAANKQKIRKYTNQIDKRQEQKLNLISSGIIEQALKKPNKTLTLSRDDFFRYFTQKESIFGKGQKQGLTTGNCFQVTAIKAFSQSKYFELFIRTSVKRNKKSGEWEFKIPFLDPNAKVVTISQKELSNKIHGGFTTPMKANEGLRALELAYIKHKYGEANMKHVNKGGSAGSVLSYLMGNKMRTNWYPMGEKSRPFNALEKNLSRIDNLDSQLVTFSIRRGVKPPKLLMSHHAYTVSKIDIETRNITLLNPHNTNKPIVITFDQLNNIKGEFVLGVEEFNHKLISNQFNILSKNNNLNNNATPKTKMTK